MSLWRFLKITPSCINTGLKCKSIVKKIIPVCQLCTINNNNNTVDYIVRHWRQRFEDESIPEPIESIEHIVAHVIGTKKVKKNSVSRSFKMLKNYYLFFKILIRGICEIQKSSNSSINFEK